ncbi:MAG TPA: hypothetical protein VG125_17765 [Pirellulales bacterium]|jgi:hypothetical protein|nr:hypothetical protein [Pirellulales bacterium]
MSAFLQAVKEPVARKAIRYLKDIHANPVRRAPGGQSGGLGMVERSLTTQDCGR